MGSFGILVLNTFEEAMRRKVIYILLFIGILFGIQALYQLAYMGMAEYAGDTEMLTNLRGQFVLSIFGLMRFCGLLLGVYLGAVALSTEIRNRTIVPVLSRPVSRMNFFFAKWVGTLVFLTVFVSAGAVVGIGMMLYWDLRPSVLFGFGVAEILLELAIVSSVGLALSSVVHPVLSGGGALLLFTLGDLTQFLSGHPSRLASFVVAAGRYLSPAGSPVDFLESGIVKSVLEPDYGLYLSVLAENAGYAVAATLTGALVFRFREIRVR